MPPNLKQLLSLDGNHQQKGGYQHQQVDGKNKGLMWFHQMGL
jgi:hypothetical protein